MGKRVLAALLALCLTAGLLPTGALAAGSDTSPAAAAAPSATKEFYVSADGNDSGDGSKEKPFPTIQKAVTAVTTEVTQIWVMSDLTVSATVDVGTKQIILSSMSGGGVIPIH